MVSCEYSACIGNITRVREPWDCSWEWDSGMIQVKTPAVARPNNLYQPRTCFSIKHISFNIHSFLI